MKNTNDPFIELKTNDHNRVVFRKDQIAAIEEIPKSNRAEGHLKIYVAGYIFSVTQDMDQLLQSLKS